MICMSKVPVILVVAMLVCVTLSVLPPGFEVVERARQAGFSEEVISKGQHFSSERRMTFWGATIVELTWLLVLVYGGWARRITDSFRRKVHGRWLPTVLLVGGFCYVSQTLLSLPFDIAGWASSTAWGMTDRSLGAWFVEHCLAFAVGAVLGGILLVGFYLLLRWLPRTWWLAATAGSIAVEIVFAFVLPIVIAPLFNTFTPIAQTRWASMEKSLRALVAKAATPVEDILVMNASKQNRHTNAYFTGFGTTRRIVLYDNLLEKHTPQEVESILAHEMGHWHHDHIVKGIALSAPVLLVGFYILSRLLKWAEGAFGLEGPDDPAGFPLILLAGFVGTWLMLPVGNAVSRHFERQADMMSLEVAGMPEVFIATEKKLVIDNIGNAAPTPFNVWMFATHPPAVERIQMAEEWKARSEK